MKVWVGFLVVLITGCASPGQYHRSYVISKSPIEEPPAKEATPLEIEEE